MANRKPVFTAISEMLGRVKERTGIFSIGSGFWGKDITVDYARSDYTLFDAVYHASVIDKKGFEYILGAGFAKPIINSATAFTIGLNFEISMDGAEDGTPIKAAEDDIRQWIEDHGADWYNMVKYGLRGGDAFVVLHDDYSIEFPKPNDVTVIYDPTTGGRLGYDITETVDEGENSRATYTRKYRRNGYKVTVNRGGTETVLINRVFTDEGIVDLMSEEYANFEGFDPAELVNVPLPVVHFANEIEPKNIYGISDIQSALVYFQGYSQVLQDATKSNRYNSTPIPVITGDKNVDVLSTTDKNKKMQWGRDIVLYLKGDNANAKYLEVPQTMGDTSKLLEIYFYLIVQTSETPEFIFGTAINGSKASAEEQMPIMVKKALRKQAQIKPILRAMIDAYIYKKVASGDQNFYALASSGLTYKIGFPPIVDDDQNLTKETIEMLVDKGIISDETALELSIIGSRIGNKAKEIEKAREDAEVRDSRVTTVFPENPNRINDELDNLDDDGNPIVNDEE